MATEISQQEPVVESVDAMGEGEVAQDAKLQGEALKDALRRQVEYYFSRENLASDTYLVSQMNSQMYVPISILAGFQKVRALTDDVKLIAESVRDSHVCSLSEDETAIKPNIKSSRNTIILREIPSDTSEEEVRQIFEGCGKILNVRSDVGDTWFVTAESEDVAVDMLLQLRSRTFRGNPIKARLKSENILRSYYPVPSAIDVNNPQAFSGAPVTPPYYMQMPWVGAPNQFAQPYQAQRTFTGRTAGTYAQPDTRFSGRRERRNTGGRGSTTPTNFQAGGAPAAAPINTAKENRKQGSVNAAHTPQGGDRAQRKASKEKKHGKVEKKGDRQPIINAANFPPLPTSSEKPKDSDLKSPVGISVKYEHDEIMEIIKHMDDDDCKVPEGAFDFEQHSVVLTEQPHPDLLRNQRTYSMEQAREAMRQGRPIRSDSVGSADYESFFYGEEYTKEARSVREAKKTAPRSRQSSESHSLSFGEVTEASAAAVAAPSPTKEQAQEEEVATKPQETPESEVKPAPPAIKKSGYAAALLANNGAAAPAPAVPSRPKTTVNASKKDDKKDESKHKGKGRQHSHSQGHGHQHAGKKGDKSTSDRPKIEKQVERSSGEAIQKEPAAVDSPVDDKAAGESSESKSAPWGGKRSFVDVLKTQSQAPSHPAATTPSNSAASAAAAISPTGKEQSAKPSWRENRNGEKPEHNKNAQRKHDRQHGDSRRGEHRDRHSSPRANADRRASARSPRQSPRSD